MFPTLQIGPLAMPVSGLVILVGLWIALTLSERRAVQQGLSTKNFNYFIFFSLGAGVIGARLFYVVQYPSAFQANLISLISINPQLFDPTGGIIFGFLGGFIYGQHKHFHLWSILDILTPGLAVMGVAFGLSHLASGDAFGNPTQLPWGISLWGEIRHPSQVYETILAGLILAIILILEKRAQTWPSGIIFWIFVGMTSASLLFLDASRGDSNLIMGGFHQNQFIAWIGLAISLFGLYRRMNFSTRQDEPI